MKKTVHLAIYATAAILFVNRVTTAQETALPTVPDTLTSRFEKTQNEWNAFKKLKITGWTHVQFQIADSAGIATYAGGSNFPSNVDKRFSVRRGRIKFVYDNGLSLFNLQIDASERNVQLRECFVKLTGRRTKTFSLTTGMFNRPFGYEISFSSSLRESPERSRWEQTLFFNERDLGAGITIQAPTTSAWHFLKIDAAMMSGSGIANVNNMGAAIANPANNTSNNTTGGNDFDYFKDFIGRVSAEKSNEKLILSGGMSYYDGGWRMGNKQVWKPATLASGEKGFTLDSSDANLGALAHRVHYGADAQLSIDFPLGRTTLRGEYITGIMPGLPFQSYNATPYSQPATPTYFRNFDGGYVYFVQNIFKTKHQIVVKYDWYDPNKYVRGQNIGVAGSNTGNADIRYDTWGFGYLCYWDANVKLSIYYDRVTNEKTQLNGYTTELKDNVLTLRIQYKF